MSVNNGRRPALWSYAKPVADLLLVFISFLLSYIVRYELQWFKQVELAYLVPISVYFPSIFALMGITVFIYWIEGAYRVTRGNTFFDEFYIIVRGSLIGISVMIVIVFLATPSYYSRLIFGYTGVWMVILIGGSRAIERLIIANRRRRGLGVERVLIVGAGEVGRSIMRSVMARPDLGYQVLGFVDDDPERSQTDIGRYPALGTTDRLPEIIQNHRVDQVIITLPWMSHRKIIQIMNQCERGHVAARIVPDLFQMTLSHVVVDSLDGIPLLGVREPALRDWQVFFKRSVDIIGCVAALLLLSPILLIIAIAIRIDSPGPIIFRQTRVGHGGAPFTIFKFRSMQSDAEAQVDTLQAQNEASGPLFKMRQDPRTTRVGRFIRRWSLDELPQLWNVLRGEMSLIGPRPAIPREVENYAQWHCRRLEVAPGITGLWQVSGRSDITFDEMVLLDVYYIENWSPLLDLRILLRTIPTVFLGWGAY